MTRHPIAQIASNRNPISQESPPPSAVSCKIGYLTRRPSPATPTAPQFFTDDVLAPRVQPEGLTHPELAVILAEIYADILRDAVPI